MLESLLHKINTVIINPLLLLMFAVAFLYFMWGVFEFIRDQDNEKTRAASRSKIMYGLIGLVMMVAVFGIWNMLLRTFNINPQPVQQIQKR
jgi:uncharacterized membrane protein YqhA